MTENVSLNKITIQAKEDFQNFLKKILDELKIIENQYSEEDGRVSFFSTFTETIIWLLIHLDIFYEMLNESDQKISKYIKLNPQSRIQYLTQHDTINKICFITKTMFDVENLIKNLMVGLKNPINNNDGYYKFTEKFLKDLDFYSTQKFKVLNAPAQLRNSLHNNGYASFNFDISLRDNSYKFIKNQRIHFANWDSIYIFYDELMTLLLEIIKHPKIEKITLISSTDIPESKIH